MILPSEIRFADQAIKEAFYRLEKGDSSEKELFRCQDLFLRKQVNANLEHAQEPTNI